MKKFAIYTGGFFLPIVALILAQNLWSKVTRFEARTAEGWLYVVDRRSGEVTICGRDRCKVIRSADGSTTQASGAFDDLIPTSSR